MYDVTHWQLTNKLAEPVCAALDPFQYAMYRLYKDHTKLTKGKYVKDITQLNRDPKKVIILDNNPDSYSLQPENGIFLKSWKGESGDMELERMGAFLEGTSFSKFILLQS